MSKPWIEILTFILLFALFWTFGVKQPYHLDTTFYMKTAIDFTHGHWHYTFQTRCLNEIALTALYLIFKKAALPVFFYSMSALSVIAYYHLIKTLFGNNVALASTVLLFTTPATLMSVLHMKEDAAYQLFISVSALLILQRRYALAGLSAALAILEKELAMTFLPFLFLLFWWKHAFKVDKEVIIKGLQFLIPFLITVNVINPNFIAGVINISSSPYMGQWLGVFSALTIPMLTNVLPQGTGALYPFLFIAMAIALYTRHPLYLILTVVAILSFVHLLNTTTTHFYSFSIPVYLLGPILVSFALKKFDERWVMVAVVIIAAYNLINTLPYLLFHSQYNPQQMFFSHLTQFKNLTFVGMDYCNLAWYYVGAHCVAHPVDPNLTQAQQFLAQLPNTFVMLPDFFAYDKHHVLPTLMANYSVKRYGPFLFEDYHNLGMGYDKGLVKQRIKAQGCDIINVDVEKDIVNKEVWTVACGNTVQRITLYTFMGKVLPYLSQQYVYVVQKSIT